MMSSGLGWVSSAAASSTKTRAAHGVLRGRYQAERKVSIRQQRRTEGLREVYRLFHFDARKFHYLTPLFNFVADERLKLGGCHYHRLTAQAGEPRLDIGIREHCIDLYVKPIDDLGRRILGRANSVP